MADTLERSFLEGKERDELAAIAGALGLKPSPRAKKDTVIEQIMRAAGVGIDDAAASAPTAPRVPRVPRGRPKARVEEGTAVEGAVAESVASEPDANSSGGFESAASVAAESQPTQGSSNGGFGGRGRNEPRRAPRASLFDPFAEADDAASSPSSDPDEDEWAFAAAKPASTPTREEASEAPKPVATPPELREGGSEDYVARRSRRDRDRDRFRDRDAGGQSGQSGQGGAPSTTGQTGTGTTGFGGQPQAGQPQGGQPQGGQQQGGQQQGGQQQGERTERPAKYERPEKYQRPDRSGGGGQGGDRQNRPSFNDSLAFDNDPSGRRNRRRRGRDKERLVTPGQDAVADRISETYTGELITIEGLLDLSDSGYGYVRAKGYLPSPNDVYVPVNKVKQYGLRKGDVVSGQHRPATAQEKFPAIVSVDKVNGHTVEVALLRPKFEDLTPLFPDVKLRLEQPGQSTNMVARIIDLVAPIGKGQRGLIVSPPKAGKTTIMKQIASSIEGNNPNVHLMVLLIDERPEEVTDMRRHVRGEVVASTFDKPSDEHTMIAELALERAKRLVEEGRDVVIILDGITRLARAYNLAAGPGTGRIMSGGIDTGALYPPKKFFGAARNIEEGGSLTILATALVETGSTMDTVIFEEFKGTGNMELRLDRRLAEKRVYPAINVNESSTRHEELLFEKAELEIVWKLRRVLQGLAEDGSAAKALELLMDRIKTTRTNSEFLGEIAKAPGVN